MIKSKKQMFTVIGAFVLVMLLTTVTYAFFNYTRTGVSNTIKTGRIYFNAEQGDTVTLSDLFPITLEASQEVLSETPGVGSLTLHVTGDTMYDDGIEYLVKAVDVTNTAGNSSLPISIAIKYEETNGNTIGMEDENYYTNRGGNSSVYKVLSTDSITDDGDLVVGYIAKGQTGIDGNITIMAYLDAKNIAISDTYPEADVTHTETSGEASNETSIEVVDYSNGTTSEWVGDRTVFTTSEWNALQTSGVSFKIKVEANEGVWVPEPPLSLADMCPGCVYMFPEVDTQLYTTWNTQEETPTEITNYSSNYNDVITERNAFFGVVLNDNHEATEVYGCALYNGNPYCLKGSSSYVANNLNILQHSSLFNGACTREGVDNGYYCTNDSPEATDDTSIFIGDDGDISVGLSNYHGYINMDNDGSFAIYTS